MTELERHLLNALEQLQQDYMQRLSESCGVPALRCMASIEKEYAQASKTGEQRGTVLSRHKAE